DFYKYYQVPGLYHCYLGSGGQPTTMFAALPHSITLPNATVVTEAVCPYPKRAVQLSAGDESTGVPGWACIKPTHNWSSGQNSTQESPLILAMSQ
ncbi:hypothetical protein HK405_006632, partial [Cladochytrium tenue]